MLDRFVRDRRRAQAGTTLVELLVSVTIMALALSLIVGTLSTGLLNSTLAKRNTAAQGVVTYELDEIQASTFNTSATSYSECFATESSTFPATAVYQAACPDPTYTLRADVVPSAGPTSTTQTWTITVVSVGTNQQIGQSVKVIKADR